jgi:hypothetical protein
MFHLSLKSHMVWVQTGGSQYGFYLHYIFFYSAGAFQFLIYLYFQFPFYLLFFCPRCASKIMNYHVYEIKIKCLWVAVSTYNNFYWRFFILLFMFSFFSIHCFFVPVVFVNHELDETKIRVIPACDRDSFSNESMWIGPSHFSIWGWKQAQFSKCYIMFGTLENGQNVETH